MLDNLKKKKNDSLICTLIVSCLQLWYTNTRVLHMKKTFFNYDNKKKINRNTLYDKLVVIIFDFVGLAAWKSLG